MNFGAVNETFKQVITRGSIFEVPIFQRNYSWSTDEIGDLWDDIINARNDKDSHYMGYLVLQADKSTKVFQIIDGQQRMSSVSILISVILKKIKSIADSGDKDAEKRYNALRDTYIGYLDPVSLEAKPRLKLNQYNNVFFQDHIVALQPFPQRGVVSTNKLIKNSFEFFEGKISSMNITSSSEYAKLIEDITETLFFTVITVDDELNAFKVFETLNARGVQLSSSDLLKNYLLSLVHCGNAYSSDIKQFEKTWNKIVGILGNEKFSDYLRYYWNSYNKTARKTELFKAIRKKIQCREDAFALINALYTNVDFYAAMHNGQDEMWNSYSSDFQNDLDILNIFKLKLHIPLLLAVQKHLPSYLQDTVKWLKMITFRYNIICEKQTNEQERIYNDIAVKVSNGSIASKSDLKNALLALYPQDEVFKMAFSLRTFDINENRAKKIVRYILCMIENHKFQQTYDFHLDAISIEHIFPEHPDCNWPEFQNDADAENVFRLGNYTLLTKNDNRNLENKAYQIKRQTYVSSNYGITRDVGNEYEYWTSATIARRQKNLSNIASTIWKIS